MNRSNRNSTIAFFTLLILTTAGSAHAYVDGGTGSFILQVAVASTVGALFAIKSYWANIKSSIARRFGRGVQDTSIESTRSDA